MTLRRATCEELETKAPEGSYIVAGVPIVYGEFYDIARAELGERARRLMATVRRKELERPLGVSMIVERADNYLVVYGWVSL